MEICVGGGAAAAAVYPAIGKWEKHRLTRRDSALKTAIAVALEVKLAPVIAKVDGVQRELDKQFGGNGGGLREKVNKSAEVIARIEAHQQGLTDRFDDHLRTAEDDRRRLERLEGKDRP